MMWRNINFPAHSSASPGKSLPPFRRSVVASSSASSSPVRETGIYRLIYSATDPLELLNAEGIWFSETSENIEHSVLRTVAEGLIDHCQNLKSCG